MINIYIKGGTKTQQRVTDEAARVFIKQLLPRKRTLNIDITIRNTLKENAAGYCTHEDFISSCTTEVLCLITCLF